MSGLGFRVRGSRFSVQGTEGALHVLASFRLLAVIWGVQITPFREYRFPRGMK